MWKAIIGILIGGVPGFAAAQPFSFIAETGASATVILPASAEPNIAGSLLEAGDQIGAFTPDGLCVGAVIWNKQNTHVTVWENDIVTEEIDGIRSGEPLLFRVWKKSVNRIYDDVDVSYQSGQGIYESNAILTISSLTAHPQEAPKLLAPVNHSTGVGSEVELKWEALSNAQSYDIQLSTASNFSTLYLDKSNHTTTSLVVGDLPSSGRLYWRVRAQTESGKTDWSAVWQFSTGQPQLSFEPAEIAFGDVKTGQSSRATLTFRIDGLSQALEGTVGTLEPPFEVVSGGGRFRISSGDEVAVQITFSPMDYVSYEGELKIAYTLDGARKVEGVTVSGTGIHSPNHATHPVRPGPGKKNASTEEQLEWTAIENASYDLEVSASNTFDELVAEESGLTENVFRLRQLENYTTYYWRVRTHHNDATSPWSDAFHFVTKLNVPVGESNPGASSSLKWEGVASADRYHLRISTDEDWTRLVVNDSTLTETEFDASTLEVGTYYWSVRAVSGESHSDWSESSQLRLLVGMSTSAERPKQISLSQNYPNPFNPATRIEYQLPQDGHVTLSVYDVLGRPVIALVDQYQRPGAYSVTFDAAELPSGVYIYRLRTNNTTITRRMLLAK